MGGIKISSFALFTIIIFQELRFADSVKTFSGIARVVIETPLHSPSEDLILDIGTSLESLLSGTIDHVTIVQNGSSEADIVTISFLGHLENFAVISTCNRNGSIYYESQILNATYHFTSMSMQNFPNDFEDQCTENGQNVAYIVYRKEECQFKSLECELNYDLNRLYRYELVDGLSVLYSFFCVNPPTDEEGYVCTYNSDWLELQWEKTQTTCLIDDLIFRVFKPSFEFISDTELDKPTTAETLPSSLMCPTFIGLPVIPVSGDQTWDKLPNWMKVCVRVINGVSLAALLFCLLTFVVFRELRNTHGKNALSLVISGMISLFYTSGYIPLATDNRELCIFIATLIYYFVLVPNYWWTAVAIFLAWTLGRKGIHRMDEDSGSRFFILLSLFGWGIPLLFSLLAVFLHIGGIQVFNIDKYCWIIEGWPNYLITVQTIIPFLVDCVLFVLVVYRLRATRLEMESMNSGGRKTQKNEERKLTMKMAAIFGVFWLPSWIVYVAFLFKPISTLAIISQLLNQLSMFILPIVLCCNHRVIAMWKAKLAPLRDRLASITHSTTTTETRSSQYDPARATIHNIHNDRYEPPDVKALQLNDIHNK